MPKDKSTAARKVRPERLAPRLGEHSVEVLRKGGVMMQAIAESGRPARACTTDGVTR